MGAELPVVVWFVVLLLLVALSVRWQVRRNRALQAWAAGVGWQCVGTDPALVGRWRGRPFGIGSSRRVSQLMTGRFGGRPASSFVYRYTTGSREQESTRMFHVLVMALPAYLPTLELLPEGFEARIANVFGGDDIKFESDAFNRAWCVRAPDRKFAHDVVHPRLMERLLRDGARVSMRIEGTDILSWTSGSTRTDVIAVRLGVMAAVVDLIPRYVWLDSGYDPGLGAAGSAGGRSADNGPEEAPA